MIFNIDELKKGALHFEFEEKAESFPVLEDLTANAECRFTAPVLIRARATRIGDIVQVQGDFRTEVILACARCLKEFSGPLAADFTLNFTSTPEKSHGESEEELELTLADMDRIPFQGREIDLREAIQEQIVLALPFRPLCDQACRGLCPHCGADLNVEGCRCTTSEINPQFAALKNIVFPKK